MKNRTKGIIQIVSAILVPIILLHAGPMIGAIIGMLIELAITGDLKDFSGFMYAGAFIGGFIGIVVGIVYFIVMLPIGTRNMKPPPDETNDITSDANS
ncbi:MAG: hypothetical protein JXM70_02635 [Pirellulales bacterium]|nr:hypothetical protein [Pirellulales bacterium]